MTMLKSLDLNKVLEKLNIKEDSSKTTITDVLRNISNRKKLQNNNTAFVKLTFP